MTQREVRAKATEIAVASLKEAPAFISNKHGVEMSADLVERIACIEDFINSAWSLELREERPDEFPDAKSVANKVKQAKAKRS